MAVKSKPKSKPSKPKSEVAAANKRKVRHNVVDDWRMVPSIHALRQIDIRTIVDGVQRLDEPVRAEVRFRGTLRCYDLDRTSLLSDDGDTVLAAYPAVIRFEPLRVDDKVPGRWILNRKATRLDPHAAAMPGAAEVGAFAFGVAHYQNYGKRQVRTTMADWADRRDASDRAEQMRLRCIALVEKMRIDYQKPRQPSAAAGEHPDREHVSGSGSPVVDEAVLGWLAAARDKIRGVVIPPQFDADTDEAKRAEERAMVREAIKSIPMDGEVWVGIGHALDDAEQVAVLRADAESASRRMASESARADAAEQRVKEVVEQLLSTYSAGSLPDEVVATLRALARSVDADLAEKERAVRSAPAPAPADTPPPGALSLQLVLTRGHDADVGPNTLTILLALTNEIGRVVPIRHVKVENRTSEVLAVHTAVDGIEVEVPGHGFMSPGTRGVAS